MMLPAMPMYETPTDMLLPGAVYAILLLAITYLSMQVPAIKKLEWEKRLYCALCASSFINASITCGPALIALWELINAPSFSTDCSSGAANMLKLRTPPPASATFACALVCGFFFQDSIMMIVYPKEMTKGLGGSSAYKIMWMHHLVSLFSWPYGICSDAAVIWITYYIATEFTNIGQNAFMLANRGGFFQKQEMTIGIVWMIQFFVVRVVPVPYMLYAYFKIIFLSPPCGLSWPEWVVCLTTIPIPIALNLFWFYKIANKAMRMMRPKKKA